LPQEAFDRFAQAEVPENSARKKKKKKHQGIGVFTEHCNRSWKKCCLKGWKAAKKGSLKYTVLLGGFDPSQTYLSFGITIPNPLANVNKKQNL
jgi:hypothetical protein